MEGTAATAEAENDKRSESTSNPRKKKRKRRKKKQAEMVSNAPGNEAEIGRPSTELSKTSDQEEDANEGFDLEDKVTPVKESGERDIQVSETASKKKKRKGSMVSEVNLNPEDIHSDNEDMLNFPEKVNSRSSFVEEGIKDPVAVESKEQEPLEDGQPPTEVDDTLIGDIRRDSGKRHNDVNEDTIPNGKDEKPPLVPDEEGGCSTPEAGTDRETAESTTITATADRAADGLVVDSSPKNLPIGDNVESDTIDDSCDVLLDNEK